MSRDPAPGMVFDVDEPGFRARVLEAQAPVLVDFWADWCAPCLALAPHLERVVREQEGRVRLAKLEVDDNMRLAGHYRVRGFPTVILFRDGEEVARFSGARSSPWLRDFLDQHLGQRPGASPKAAAEPAGAGSATKGVTT